MANDSNYLVVRDSWVTHQPVQRQVSGLVQVTVQEPVLEFDWVSGNGRWVWKPTTKWVHTTRTYVEHVPVVCNTYVSVQPLGFFDRLFSKFYG